MHILKKLYPRNGDESYLTTTSLVFIAEGYTVAQETQFYQDVDQAFQRILDYHSLINLRRDNNSLSVYTLFIPSAQSGIASNATEAINRTPFESYLSNGLHLNYNKIRDVLDDAYFASYSNEQNKLSTRLVLMNSDELESLTKALPVFIFPNITSQVGEFENLIANQYYYVATTLDNFYEQAILRAVFRLWGLGDEFELDGNGFLEPDDEVGTTINFLFPNLFYTANLNLISPSTPDFKWRNLFTSFDSTTITTHPHPGSVNTPDRTLPSIPFSYRKIELWEGGGGFRKKIYRVAQDCLLRRRIGDPTLPVKEKKIALCPVCEFSINKEISN